MSRLASFAEELKALREAKQISLQHISAATRISVKFLQALEEGRFSVLPEVYIRAFIREYSMAIGEDEQAILRRYDEAVKHDHVEEEPAHESDVVTDDFPADRDPNYHRRDILLFLQRNLIPILTLLTVLLIVVFLTTSDDGTFPPSMIPEAPFDLAVRESEAVQKQAASAPRPTKPDSLHLEIFTTDSVWIQVVIDGMKTEEYLLPPQWRRSWSAGEQFNITIGNAGGATFRLNGRDIGSLGKPGSVVRNALLTYSTTGPL